MEIQWRAMYLNPFSSAYEPSAMRFDRGNLCLKYASNQSRPYDSCQTTSESRSVYTNSQWPCLKMGLKASRYMSGVTEFDWDLKEVSLMAGPFPCSRGWPMGIDINTFAFRKMNWHRICGERSGKQFWIWALGIWGNNRILVHALWLSFLEGISGVEWLCEVGKTSLKEKFKCCQHSYLSAPGQLLAKWVWLSVIKLWDTTSWLHCQKEVRQSNKHLVWRILRPLRIRDGYFLKNHNASTNASTL